MFVSHTLALLLLLNTAVQAFVSGGQRHALTPAALHLHAGAPSISCADDVSIDEHEKNEGLLQIKSSRRNFLCSSVGGAGAMFGATLTAQPANAAAASSVRVAEWPNLAYLEPIYELSLSVSALAKTVGDTSKWPLILKRLEKFFKGALLSERNYYTGVAITYMNEIKYDKSETNEYIKIDKSKRYEAFEACMKNLELLKNDISANESADNVKADADAAQRALADWFSYVPSEDVQAVGKLFVRVKSADTDRNGRLDDLEMQALSEEDRSVWKKRVDLFGDI